MSNQDNRIRFPVNEIDFTNDVGLTGQIHDLYAEPGTLSRYDWMRSILLGLLTNQASVDEMQQFRNGSIHFDLATFSFNSCCSFESNSSESSESSSSESSESNESSESSESSSSESSESSESNESSSSESSESSESSSSESSESSSSESSESSESSSSESSESSSSSYIETHTVTNNGEIITNNGEAVVDF